jgi:hypothetical protein
MSRAQVTQNNHDEIKEFKYIDPKYGYKVHTFSRAQLLDIEPSSPVIFNAFKEAGYAPESSYSIIRLEKTGFNKQRAILITKEEFIIFNLTGFFRRKKELYQSKWKDISTAKIDRNIFTVEYRELLPLFDLDRLSPKSKSFIEINNSLNNWDQLIKESELINECKDYEDARKAQLLYIDAINEICAYLNFPRQI